MPRLSPSAALVLVLALLLGPVLALLSRRRWRLAAAKREEVMRLAMLAAAEAERAEEEAANYAYMWEKNANAAAAATSGGGGGGGVGGFVTPKCEVCYSPTTTRCSRCKAVRYCSGKCQIIHWRQGHKEGCRPPEAGNRSINEEIRIQGERSSLFSNNLESEGNSSTRFSSRPASSESNSSSEDFSEDGNLENRFLFDTSGTESSSESTTGSSPSTCSTFSCPADTTDDAYPSGDSVHYTSTSGNSPHSTKTPVSRELELSKLTFSEVDANLPVSAVPCVSNFNLKTRAFKTQEVECDSIGPSRVEATGSYTPRIKPRGNLDKYQDASTSSRAFQNSGSGNSTISHTYHADDLASSRVEHFANETSLLDGTLRFKTRDVVALNVDRSACGSSARVLKSESFVSPSASSDDHRCSGEGDQSVVSCASIKIGTGPTYPMRMSQGTDLVQNDCIDLKTSARGVQKMKSSAYSRNGTSRIGSYSGKYNNKMLFPYDLFIKLYNSDKVDLRPCGLTNCGNSCYANAVLQCLAFTRPFTAYLLQGLHSKACPKLTWCFTCEFESLLLKAKQGRSPLSPIGITSHINDIGCNLGHGKEEDAHEFLRYAIDAMENARLKEAGRDAVDHLTKESTLAQLTFGGYLRSEIKCMKCKSKSERHERMMDLTVEIHGDIGTLEEALVRFTATEILDGDNKYQCNRCKSYEPAKKKLTILEAPNVLTIALKRFQSGKFGKINKTIRFPEYLNLAPYMRGSDDKSPVYKLYAVVVHLDIMNAAFSGHYVCYVKDTQGKWYKIDDSKVKPVDLERVLKQGAYMLFYARCSPRAPSLLRKAMVYDHGNMKSSREDEVDSSRHPGESHSAKSSSSSMFLHHSPLFARRKSLGEYAHQMTNDSANSGSFDLFSESFHLDMDSSSDSSSLLSCSDGSSSSTDSSRDSSSEFSEYIFGESGMSWNSPKRFSDDSDVLAYSPLRPRHRLAAV